MFHPVLRYLPVLLLAFVPGCATGPDPIAFKNKTFYEYGTGGPGAAAGFDIEQRYPPLDNSERSYIGVEVLNQIVRFSRPANWVVRRGDISRERRFIEYVSPSQIAVAIYERTESPLDPWRDVMARYESQLSAEGAKIIGKPFSVASFNAQGREYVIERSISAPKMPYINHSREILLRGNQRIVLVQVVHQKGVDIERISQEILPVLTSMQVL
jgi:hypothetical protein